MIKDDIIREQEELRDRYHAIAEFFYLAGLNEDGYNAVQEARRIGFDTKQRAELVKLREGRE